MADTNKLIAVPFDADSIETVGAAVVVLTDVQIRPGVGSAQLTVSRDGTLLYKPGVVIEAALFSVERSGEATQLFEDTDFFHHPRLSPTEPASWSRSTRPRGAMICGCTTERARRDDVLRQQVTTPPQLGPPKASNSRSGPWRMKGCHT